MNWFDIIILIIAIYSIFKGFRSGFVKQLASLIGIVACILLSGKTASVLLPYIQGKVSENWIEPVAFIAAFLLIFAAVMLLGQMLQSILETIKLGKVNKLIGAGLCLAKWMIVISIITNLFAKMDTTHILIPSDIEESSKLYKHIQPIAPKITPNLKFETE